MNTLVHNVILDSTTKQQNITAQLINLLFLDSGKGLLQVRFVAQQIRGKLLLKLLLRFFKGSLAFVKKRRGLLLTERSAQNGTAGAINFNT